jgi:hypothetical protein
MLLNSHQRQSTYFADWFNHSKKVFFIINYIGHHYYLQTELFKVLEMQPRQALISSVYNDQAVIFDFYGGV